MKDKMKVKQKEIIIDESVDFEELFRFPKLVINDMFKNIKLKGKINPKIEINITFEETEDD